MKNLGSPRGFSVVHIDKPNSVPPPVFNFQKFLKIKNWWGVMIIYLGV